MLSFSMGSISGNGNLLCPKSTGRRRARRVISRRGVPMRATRSVRSLSEDGFAAPPAREHQISDLVGTVGHAVDSIGPTRHSRFDGQQHGLAPGQAVPPDHQYTVALLVEEEQAVLGCPPRGTAPAQSAGLQLDYRWAPNRPRRTAPPPRAPRPRRGPARTGPGRAAADAGSGPLVRSAVRSRFPSPATRKFPPSVRRPINRPPPSEGNVTTPGARPRLTLRRPRG
jgi:hypothetical protein